ncbi:AtpZ/AtpI family protein [Vannielia litorea]|uniref:AtpZ/AtpI family protein n=1 Tax=Vannielia TaxID=2813041 RepID=UPI001C9509F1|nr:AtpZ/AtpI family protein [Vannielia litorea]MBY6046102.1 AtpZ/AtpI family protein [Vannielia litorea]MBY6073515.1 AtpZ/AtpI family protein [Vannielia litorea]
MAGSGDEQRLDELDAKLAAHKAKYAPPPPKDDHYHAASQGWRMVIELVSGLGIGVAVGYGLDVLFGTLPLFLVVFTLLGFAAGVRVMMRTAAEFQNAPKARAEDEKRDEDGD